MSDLDFISLLAWAKREGVTYSTAQKMVTTGEIPGATRSSTGKRVLVPASFKRPAFSGVECAICHASFPQITSTHLKTHGISVVDYKLRYPTAQTVGDEVAAKISDALTGRERSEAHSRAISEAKKGVKLKTPRPKGVVKHTQEAKDNMARAQLGRKHSEETKLKIGEGNLGKIMPREAVERQKKSLAKYYAENDHHALGKKMDAAFCEKARLSAIAREAAFSDEQKAARMQRRIVGLTGIKRTPEQKLRYAAARTKWMEENPLKVERTSGERTIEDWLAVRQIEYTRQYRVEGLNHPFDFYIPEFHLIIEFDGPHHWRGRWWKVKGKTPAEIAEILARQQAKDQREAEFARAAGYRVVRILGVADVGGAGHGTLDEQLAEQGIDDLLECPVTDPDAIPG